MEVRLPFFEVQAPGDISVSSTFYSCLCNGYRAICQWSVGGGTGKATGMVKFR